MRGKYQTVRNGETGLAVCRHSQRTKTNAVLYTLVESARTNALDVYAYLKYLLTEMPNNHYPEHPEILEKYLPWSEELPEECRLKRYDKKCCKL